MRSLLSRTSIILSLALFLPLTGCSHRYVITTTSGMKLVTANKPKRQDDWFVYKDASGKPVQISAMRVRMIEPYSKRAAGKEFAPPDLR